MNVLQFNIQNNLNEKGKNINDITYRDCAYCLIEVYNNNDKLAKDLINLKKSNYKFINTSKIKSQLNGSLQNLSNELIFALSDLFDTIMQKDKG